MNIRDWWNRLLSKFSKKDSDENAGQDPVQAMELIAEEAPEPVPERKTSDEMIEEMAESTLVKEEVRMQEEIPAEVPEAQELIPEEEEIPEQEEDPWYEEETDNTGEKE